jgi:hypothetical protein
VTPEKESGKIAFDRIVWTQMKRLHVGSGCQKPKPVLSSSPLKCSSSRHIIE